jgi:hypothetical protein
MGRENQRRAEKLAFMWTMLHTLSMLNTKRPTAMRLTDRLYTIRAAALKGLDLIRPTRADKTILIYDWSSGKGRCLVEASNWADARTKLNAALQGQA